MVKFRSNGATTASTEQTLQGKKLLKSDLDKSSWQNKYYFVTQCEINLTENYAEFLIGTSSIPLDSNNSKT